MKKTINIACSTLCVIALAGCNNGSSNKNNDDDTAQNANVDRIFSAGQSDEPITLNASELNAELVRVFGHPNDAPVDVETNDTLADVQARAESN